MTVTVGDRHRRVLASAGYCDTRKLPRGPSGRPLCRWCGKEVQKRRRSWCSQSCIDEHRIRSDQGFAAAMVLKRDQGVCAKCGRDCLALLEELRGLAEQDCAEDMRAGRRRYWCRPGWDELNCGHESCIAASATWVRRKRPPGPRLGARLAELGVPKGFHHLHRRLWEMDHIVPVVEGGGSCGLANLRTLCLWCHRQETTALAQRRARARDPQQRLFECR